MVQELIELRVALIAEPNLEQVAQYEYGVRDAGLYEHDELVEICVAIEDRQRWL